MATFLYKLGRLAFRRRHFVALIWVALLTLAGGAASAPTAGNTSFSVPGTEAQKPSTCWNSDSPARAPTERPRGSSSRRRPARR